jgi:hypothetical protein
MFFHWFSYFFTNLQTERVFMVKTFSINKENLQGVILAGLKVKRGQKS